MEQWFYLIPAAGVLALLYALVKSMSINKIDAGNEEIQIAVTGGDYVRPYRPIPNSLDDLLDTLEVWYPSRSLIVSVYREREGLSTRHGLLQELPDSVLETLRGSGGTRQAIRFKQLARRVLPTRTLIEGEHTIKLDVLKRKKF